MKAKQIMNTEVVVVEPDMSVHDVAELFLKRGISGAPVVHMDRLMGLVTEGDLVDKVKKVHLPTLFTILDSVIPLGGERQFEEDLRKMAATTVEQIMTREVVTVDEEAELSEVATLISEERQPLIPVLREGEVVGIIGKRDLIRAMLEEGDV